MAKQDKHAEWLEKDGKKGLFHADDVDAAKIDGWKKIDGMRANGEPWNPIPEEGEAYQLDATAEAAKAANAITQAKADKKAKEAADAAKANAKAAEDDANRPNFKVQIVDPPKAKK